MTSTLAINSSQPGIYSPMANIYSSKAGDLLVQRHLLVTDWNLLVTARQLLVMARLVRATYRGTCSDRWRGRPWRRAGRGRRCYSRIGVTIQVPFKLPGPGDN